MPQQQPEPLTDSASRLGRFAQSQKSATPNNSVANLQKFAKDEAERQRKKKEEEEARKKAGVNTAPEEGFLTRMYKKYISGEK